MTPYSINTIRLALSKAAFNFLKPSRQGRREGATWMYLCVFKRLKAALRPYKKLPYQSNRQTTRANGLKGFIGQNKFLMS